MRTTLVSVLAAILVAGCGPGYPESPPQFGGTADGSEGAWRLTAGRTADGRLEPAGRSKITLVIGAAEVSGTSACNQYFGTPRRRSSGIRFEGLGGTEMACDPAVMELERRYLAALAEVDSAHVDRTRLVLTGPGVRLQYAPLAAEADAVLTETRWHLETLLDGEVASSAAGNGRLMLDEDGHLKGIAGCLPFEGRHDLTADRLAVSDLRTPGGMTDCPLQGQHDAVVEILAADPALANEGSTLTVTTTDGRGLVYRAEP